MKALEGQTLFDIAIQSCGSAEAAFGLAVMNGLNLTDELLTGSDLVTPDVLNTDVATYFQTKNIQPATLLASTVQSVGGAVPAQTYVQELPSNVIRVMESQTFFDIAIQESGSIEAAFLLAIANGYSITDDVASGNLLEKTVGLTRKGNPYRNWKNINPASGLDIDSRLRTFDNTFDFTFY